MEKGLRKIAFLYGGLVVRSGGKTVVCNGDGTVKGATLKTAQNALAPNATDKGAYNGLCNRKACLAPLGGMGVGNWWNRSTRLYYCQSCAVLINQGLSTYMLDEETRICIPIGPDSARPDLSHI